VVKLVFLCRRRPDLTRAEYARRVLEEHAPLALRHHPTLRRYEIHVAESDPEDGPEVDSLPALWFESLADFSERLYDSPDGREAIRRDVARFMAGPADAYATREIVRVDARPAAARGARTPGAKWIRALRRAPRTSREDFLGWWLETRAPDVARAPGLARYALSIVEARLSEAGEDWDGFEEIARGLPGPPPAAFAAALGPVDARRVARAPCWRVAEYVQK
jgi:hypothetical protein